MLVVGTVRTGEPHEDEELLAELRARAGRHGRLRPAPLSAEATSGIVVDAGWAGRSRRCSPTPATARPRATRCCCASCCAGWRPTGRTPTPPTPTAVVAVGSRAVSSMVPMRLRRLPPEVIPVARAAAVLGHGRRRCPRSPRWPSCPEPADRGRARRCWPARRSSRTSQPLGFVHPLVREAVYRDLPAGERALRHERAAPAARRCRSRSRSPPTFCWPRGGATTRPSSCCCAAARTAAERGASDSAVTYCAARWTSRPSERTAARRARPSSACSRPSWTAPRAPSTCCRPTRCRRTSGSAPIWPC